MRIPEIVAKYGPIVYAEARCLVSWNGSHTLNILLETSVSGEYVSVDVRTLSTAPISLEKACNAGRDFYAYGE